MPYNPSPYARPGLRPQSLEDFTARGGDRKGEADSLTALSKLYGVPQGIFMVLKGIKVHAEFYSFYTVLQVPLVLTREL